MLQGTAERARLEWEVAIGNLLTGLVKPIGANRTVKPVTVSPLVAMATVGRVAITSSLVPFLSRP